MLAPLVEVSSDPKGREIIRNNDLEVDFCEINHIFSTETLLNYPDWKISFMVQKYDYDK